MNLFYADELSPEEGTLGSEESHHASRVLRMAVGDPLLVTHGKGIIYQAELKDISKKSASFKITGIHKQEEKKRHTHIAIAPTKSNDRFETFIEKATELGVAEITPIICEHSERKVYKTERGRKIIAAGAKQSLSAWWPVLHEPAKFNEFLLQAQPAESSCFIAYCGEGEKEDILDKLPQFESIVMLIGPEGDFSPQEVKVATEKGFQLVSLGSKRLRTETAGMAVAMAHGLF